MYAPVRPQAHFQLRSGMSGGWDVLIHVGEGGGGGSMTSGFESSSMTLTSGHTHSVRCSQIVVPCCHCSANQISAEWCLGFTARVFHGLSGSAHPPPTAPVGHKSYPRGGGGGLVDSPTLDRPPTHAKPKKFYLSGKMRY